MPTRHRTRSTKFRSTPSISIRRHLPLVRHPAAARASVDFAPRRAGRAREISGIRQRRGQRPHLFPQPLPRTKRNRMSKITAPTVAFAIALTMPSPRWIPTWGKIQLPMKAPTTPTMRSPTRPKPAPLTIWPASHPAITPTSNTTRRLSFDICIATLPSIRIDLATVTASSRRCGPVAIPSCWG